MEVNEALRRVVGGHWPLLLACLMLPLLVITAVEVRAPRSFVASARIQASSTSPGSDTEADAVLNRVKGIATSTAIIGKAVQQASIKDRTPSALAQSGIEVARLGSAAVFDLTVTDTNPQVATSLAEALSQLVVDFLNHGGSQQSSDFVADLTKQQSRMLAQRQKTAADLALGPSAAVSAQLSAQLGTMDQQLADLAAALRQVEIAAVTNGSAAVISGATSAQQAPSRIVTDLSLGTVLGLVAGLLLATTLEVVRPRVSDPAAFGREVGAPLMGGLTVRRGRDSRTATANPVGPEIVVALRRAIAEADVATLVLIGAGPAGRLGTLAVDLGTRLARTAPATENCGAFGVDDHALPAAFTGGATLTRPSSPVREAPVRRPLPTQVIAVQEVDDAAPPDRPGLLVVVGNLTPYSLTRRVNSLAVATGWPLLGVLGEPGRWRGPRR